jgi:hypothetical protein
MKPKAWHSTASGSLRYCIGCRAGYISALSQSMKLEKVKIKPV